MRGITELAKLFKERENANGYSPMIGRIIGLPYLKIRLEDKIILTLSHIKTFVSLNNFYEYGVYYLGKEVVQLPYSKNERTA